MATQYAFGRITTDGLVLALDAADRNSYVSGSLIWNDLSGNNNSGSLTNGPTFNTGSGGSIVFDGVDDFVNVTPFSFLQNYTVSTWIRPTSYTLDSYNTFIARGSVFEANTNFSFSIRLRVVSLDWRLTSWWNTGNSGIEWDITNSPINTWNNFVITRSGSSSIAYKNATSLSVLGQVNQTVLPTDGSQSLTIGKPNTVLSTDVRYVGGIAQTLIYNRALSAAEVLQNYNAQKSRFNL